MRLPILYLLLGLISLPALGNWTPQIVTYARSEYKAGSQNWQIAQRGDHWMYFANKAGILEFNGTAWNLYPFDNSSDGRSLLCAADNRRIYVGGINEFGYLQPDETGALQYVNLSVQIPRGAMTVGNVWKIYEIDDAVYFCGDNLLVRWRGNRFQNIPCPDKVDCSGLLNNTLYIGTTSGLYVLAGDTFYPLPASGLLTHKKLRAIIPFYNDMLVAASDALYLVDKNGCRPFITQVDAFIRENGLFSMAVYENILAVGTVRKGVVLIDHKGMAMDYFNESHGLHDNTVLSLFFDSDHNLWLGQDNGIGFVALHNPLKNLYTHPNFYGSGYAAALYNNLLYLGTNRGLYTIPWSEGLSENAPRPHAVPQLQGQVWSLSVIDNKLMCCMDTGLYMIDANNRIETLDLPVGVWSFRPMLDNPSAAWISTYNGFFTTRKKKDGWEKPTPVEGPAVYTIINYQEIAPGVLFLRDNYNEFIKATLNDSRTQITDTVVLGVSKIPANSFVYKWYNRVICCTRSGFFQVDETGNLHPDQEMNQWTQVGNDPVSYKSLSAKGNLVCVLSDHVIGAYNEQTGFRALHHHALPLIANFEELVVLNDSLSIIPNENGFALWNILSATTPSSKLQIIKIESIKNNATLYVHAVTQDALLSIPYKDRSLRFHFHLLDYANTSPRSYSCRLDEGDWVQNVSGVKDYENISIGKHRFMLKTDFDVFEDFSFTILPPWYKKTWAYGIYSLLTVFFCLGVWYWDDRRIKLKNRQLELKQKKQIRIKEQEITQLKNERLELEVKHKNQELANTAINLARKNEVLTEIRGDLSKVSEGMKIEDPDLPTLRRKILILNNKISENIFQDDSLKKFEEHFDLVHNKFMEHLTAKYPELSANERKMCAFIKMNLSSKEIAPLLNISIRGVETLRYRLRKKIGLKQEENLIIFLNKF
ncbi:MAG: hypothetical protein FWG54_06830 [Bacteroidetes bacterium]|nr:hypothetical protein [Bacteroidota bacterium]